MRCCRLEDLSTLTTDAASQLDVLGHDGDTLGVNGSQVGVLKQTNKVCLSSLLESQDSRGLEPQVSLEVLGDLTHQPLERQLADQQLGGLLVLPDLTQGDGSRPVSVRLQHRGMEVTQTAQACSPDADRRNISHAGWSGRKVDTFLTPPVAGALFLAALVANCLRGALPPVDLRAVCLVRAMLERY